MDQPNPGKGNQRGGRRGGGHGRGRGNPGGRGGGNQRGGRGGRGGNPNPGQRGGRGGSNNNANKRQIRRERDDDDSSQHEREHKQGKQQDKQDRRNRKHNDGGKKPAHDDNPRVNEAYGMVFGSVKGERAFVDQHQMRRFVIACSYLDAADLLELLAGRGMNGLTRLKEIANSNISISAGSMKGEVSFQRVIIPLLHSLTRSDVKHSALTDLLNTIYRTLFVPEFLNKLYECLLAIYQKGNFNDDHYAPSSRDTGETWVPSSLGAIVRPILEFLLESLWKFKDVDISEGVDQFVQTCSLVLQEIPTQDHEKGAIENLLNQIRKHVTQSRQHLEKGSDMASRAKAMAANPLKKPTSTRPIITSNGPGELSQLERPRHDNDNVDFREIRTAPTAQEVLCPESPFLPMNTYGGSFFLPPGSGLAHVDMHFRLFRHDMLNPLCVAAQAFHEAGGISKLSHGRFHIKIPGGTDLCLYGNAVITSITCTNQKGMCYEVEVDQPPHMQSKSPVDRRKYWDQSKQLMHGSLVCLWTQDLETNQPKIVFGVVSDKNKASTGGDRLALSLSSCTDDFDQELFSFVKQTSFVTTNRKKKKNAHVSNVVLIQASGNSFFAYEPVLQALKGLVQKLVPFTQYLCRDPSQGPVTVLPPAYLTPQTTYDLTPLFIDLELSKMPPPVREMLRAIRIHDPNAFPVQIFEKYSSLDGAQLDAIRSALTRELALIQGPPGTGKTYVGIKLVNLLVQNSTFSKQNTLFFGGGAKNSLGPILCVCYTNHALDQFLEGLMKSGITNIVRIGGRSKSEELTKLNLKELQKNTCFNRSTSRLIGECFAEMEDIQNKIEELKGKLFQKSFTEREFMTYLSTTAYSFWTQLASDDEGEFQRSDPWGVWSKGKDISPKRKRQKKGRNTDSEESNKTHNKYAALESGGSKNIISQEKEQVLQNRTVNPAGLLSIQELEDSEDIWSIALADRKKLIEHWTTQLQGQLEIELSHFTKRFAQVKKRLRDIYDERSLAVMRSVSVVGMTTSGVAKRQKLITSLAPRIIVCEEAAEVLEAHILACLSADSQHLILIGDHQQLRPKTEVYELSVESRKGFDLDISLFERLVNEKVPVHTLSTQRRMRPEIAELVRSTLYPKLRDSPFVLNYPPVKGCKKNLFFLDHNHPEDGNDQESRSKKNQFEVKMVVGLVRYFLRQGYKNEDLTVLTPYLGQFMEIRAALSKSTMLFIDDRDLEEVQRHGTEEQQDEVASIAPEGDSDSDDSKKQTSTVFRDSIKNHVRLATIDNFQGEESKIVIISLVRNHKDGRIGFLKTSNRINVLLSRAKEGLFILGHKESLCRHKKSTMWPQVLQLLDANGSVGNGFPLVCQNHTTTESVICTPEDFDRYVGDGGCALTCTARLPCGHQCSRRCHPDDPTHEVFKCEKECNRIRLEVCPYQHPCPKRCCEPCGNCTVQVTTKLSCGHTMQVPCYKEALQPDKIECTHLVEITTSGCGHVRSVPCHNSKLLKARENCDSQCGAMLPCGHKCLEKCGSCNSKHPICQATCRKANSCGHSCNQPCHFGRPCPPCDQKCLMKCSHTHCPLNCKSVCSSCVEPCTWYCPHEQYCLLPCGAPCIRPPCDQRCTKLLKKCRHQCPGLCGEKCPSSASCRLCPGSKKDAIVDFVSFTELADHDPSSDPLIELSCGHTYAVSFLDGFFEMEKLYIKENDKWKEARKLDGALENFKLCPQCRAPIVNVLRYGRSIKKAQVDQSERKFITQSSNDLSQHSTSIEPHKKSVDTLQELKAALPENEEARIVKLLAALEKEKATLSKFCDRIKASPSQATYAASVSVIKRKFPTSTVAPTLINTPLQSATSASMITTTSSDTNSTSSSNPKSANAVDSTKTIAAKNGTSSTVAISSSDTPSKDGISATNINSKLSGKAPADTDANPPPFEANSTVATISSSNTPSKGGVSANSPISPNSLITQPATNSTKLIEVTYGTSSTPSIGDRLLNTLSMPVPDQTSYISALILSGQVSQFLVQVNFNLYAHFKLKLSAPDEIQKSKMMLHIRKCSTCFTDANGCLSLAIEQSKQTKLNATLVRACLAKSSLLVQYVRGPAMVKRQMPEDYNPDTEKKQQLDYLQEVNELCTFVLATTTNDGDKTHAHDIIATLEPLRVRVEGQPFYAPVTAEEKKAIVQAIEVGGIRADGHWYTCPNGHVYVIGECGGAMEESRCPECGLAVGGGQHQLVAGNTQAANFLREARQ